MKNTLQNKHCAIEYREDDKQIFGRDLTDMYNEPAFYTKSKRGLKQAWILAEKNFTQDTTMGNILSNFSHIGIKTHYWCMVD